MLPRQYINRNEKISVEDDRIDLIDHALDIRRAAQRQEESGIIDQWSADDMALVATAGKDLWIAFEDGYFANPRLGIAFGAFAFDNMEAVLNVDDDSYNQDFFDLLSDHVLELWYSLNLTEPPKMELDERRRVTEASARKRFVQETRDIAEAIEHFVTVARSSDGSLNARSLVAESLESNDEYGEVLRAVCGASCIDPSLRPFIRELIIADFPYDEDPESKMEIIERLKRHFRESL